MKTKQWMKMLPALLLLTACQGKEDRAERPQPVRVKVAAAVREAAPAGPGYPGTVEEENGTPLSFATSGTVKSVHVGLGQEVRRGQLVATLDPTSLRESHNLAQATLRQAEDAWQRMKVLHDKGSLPEIKWVEAQSRLEQARAAERIAAKQLADCKLYAPFSGRIAEKNVEVGQNVAPGIPVASLVTADVLKVRVAVPEAEMGRIAVGQQARVTVQALGGRTFAARVVEKGVVAHSLSRSYDVKLRVEGRPEGLLPGMVADVALLASTPAEGAACVLPAGVVQLDEQNRTFVWVVKGGKARRRAVTCGRYVAEGVEVRSGLSAADSVIVEGQQKVCEGTEVSL